MIGPAEIEEMMAEFAETAGRPDPADSGEPSWPPFVREEHLDEADRQLIGSPRRWVQAVMRAA